MELIDRYFSSGMEKLFETERRVQPVSEQLLEVLNCTDGVTDDAKQAVADLLKQISDALTQEMVVFVLSAGCGSHASIITSATHSFPAESRTETRRISDSRTGKWRVLARKVQNVLKRTTAKRFEPDKDTLALYHFDEGSGDVLKDSSGNSRRISNSRFCAKITARSCTSKSPVQDTASTSEKIRKVSDFA